MSNLHKDLLNTELHNPKDFSTASNNTILRKNNTGNLEWSAENGGGIVTSLTTTGTSGASTLVGGVLNVPTYAGGVTKILAGTNVTISPTSGLGNVTINASGGGGEVVHNTSTTWQGCVNITEEGRAATAYTFPLVCEGRDVDVMSVAVGNAGATIPTTPMRIIAGTKVNITKNGTQNYSWTGKVQAIGQSVGGFLRLYKATLVCEGVQPPSYSITQLSFITIPALATNGFFCFSVKNPFTAILNDGDVIIPIFDGQNGVSRLHYTNTLELTHP